MAGVGTKRKEKKTKAAVAGKTSRSRTTGIHEAALRDQLAGLLDGGDAHADFDRAIGDLPVAQRGARLHGAPHTAWQLLEHMRIAQWDILEFSRNPRHRSPPFPSGYWPPTEAPPDGAAWDRSVRSFQRDLRAMADLVKNPKTDLFGRIPQGEGQTVLREALLVADHNAYHLGQMVLLRRLLGNWTAS